MADGRGLEVLLDGRVVLVTGGSGNLGSAFGGGMARSGARVVLLARDPARLDETARRIRESSGNEVRWVAGDLQDRSRVAGTARQVWEAFGSVDAVVNSAVPSWTQQPTGDLLSTPEEMWWQAFDPIVLGALALARELVPYMRDNGGGSFVNLGSPTGVNPYPGMDAYGLAKGGLMLLTRYMAREWGRWNIRANALVPGLIADGHNLTSDSVATSPALRPLLDRTALGRAGTPDELVGIAAFLCSPAASFISGAAIPVDGGRF